MLPNKWSTPVANFGNWICFFMQIAKFCFRIGSYITDLSTREYDFEEHSKNCSIFSALFWGTLVVDIFANLKYECLIFNPKWNFYLRKSINFYLSQDSGTFFVHFDCNGTLGRKYGKYSNLSRNQIYNFVNKGLDQPSFYGLNN